MENVNPPSSHVGVRSPRNFMILLCGILLLTAPWMHAMTVYVNDGSTTGDVYSIAIGNNANPGTKSLPLASLQFALANFAFNAGDTIYVDAGSYTDQMIAVTSADAGVVIQGAGRSLTIFDGVNRLNRWMIVSGNNVHLRSMTVKRYGHPTGLAGQALTLQDATGMEVQDILFDDQGTSGGEATIYIVTTTTLSTSVTISNCVIQNTIGNFGGGIDICANTISALPSLTVTIDDCLIENCGKSLFNGGALLIYKGLSAGGSTQAPVVTANNCVFGAPGRGNLAQRGGAIYVDNGSTLTLNGACVSDNSANDLAGPDGGGGIYVLDGTVNLINGMITNNTANGGTPKYGGGIFVNKLFSGTSTLNISQTVISGNLGLDGAGIYLDRATTTMRNVLLYANTASDEGGAIILSDAACFLTMINCTVAANTTTSASGSRHGGLQNKQCGLATIKNCIFWGNARADVSGATNLTVSFSVVDPAGSPTFTDGGSNSTADPLFVNAASNDFRLTGSSPAINAGTLDGGAAPTSDIVGTMRVGLPDMGAYELGAASILVRDCPTTRQQILPMRLDALVMDCGSVGAVARWKAAWEGQAPAFKIEGSRDGDRFTTIVDLEISQSQLSSQDFEVNLPTSANNFQYFRVAARDANDHAWSYSPAVIHVPCGRAGSALLVYPSLVDVFVNFELHAATATEFEVTIVDIAGRVVQSASFTADRHLQAQLETSGLPAGMYFLKANDHHGNIAVQRFLKN